MKPQIICHMLASLDGGLHPSRYTKSPDGTLAEWSSLYEHIHNDLAGDAWIVGRVTMAEMSKAVAHPPANAGKVDRPYHFAQAGAGIYAVALDPSGRLHFSKPDIGGDHVVVLLGRDVADSHLAELAADGVSYIVAETADIDLASMVEVLCREFGIRRLLLEGGAGINGSFLAAGLVDELSLLVAPALDGRAANQGFVEFGESGLAGKMQLSLTSCEALAHGLVHLRYAVAP
ncbi:RibD family protein [Mesorhizobium sp. M0051]|uniref:RibD family protein n=1 Tax=unclassified Mesorhizobium TaxID=325217 RepID=UPI0003CEDF76|nr:RibD family protein [Mesorhizobium sp. LNHC252B00]ESY71966.1 riboflavin deaminase [Mesorhizobium sp. LNHC252B00]